MLKYIIIPFIFTYAMYPCIFNFYLQEKDLKYVEIMRNVQENKCALEEHAVRRLKNY